MPSISSLTTNPVLVSSLVRILEIDEVEFREKCKIVVTSIAGASEFSSVYKVVVNDSRDGGEEWAWFMKVTEGEGMVRGEFYSLKAIFLSVPDICPLPYCYGSLPASPPPSSSLPTFFDDEPGMPPLPPPSSSPSPLDSNPSTSSESYFLLTDFIHKLHTSSSRLLPRQRLSYKLAKLHNTPAPSSGVPGFPVTTMCGSTPQPNHPVPIPIPHPATEDSKEEEDGDAESPPAPGGWTTFFTERRLKAIGARCPNTKTISVNDLARDITTLIERVCDEVVPKLLSQGDDGGHGADQIVVCHGDLWSGNYTLGRIQRAWGAWQQPREGDNTVYDDGDDGTQLREPNPNPPKARGERKLHKQTLTGEFIFDPAAVYAPALYDHGIMHMFGGFGDQFWSSYWYYRKDLSLFPRSPSESPIPLTWDIKATPAERERTGKLYELYHYSNHYALFGWTYGMGAERILKQLLGMGGEGDEPSWEGAVRRD